MSPTIAAASSPRARVPVVQDYMHIR